MAKEIGINAKPTQKNINKAKKIARKIPTWAIITALVCLIVGAAAGVGASYLITKNDCFVLMGEREVTITKGDKYVEAGAKLVRYGKDVSSEVTVEGEVNVSEAGVYYLKYRFNGSGKYSDYQRVRTVIVKEVADA